MSLAQYISKVNVYCGLQIAFKIATILNIVLFYESLMALLLVILLVTTDIYEKEKRDIILIYGECNKNYSAATRLCHISMVYVDNPHFPKNSWFFHNLI
jgi:hypothetical protein